MPTRSLLGRGLNYISPAWSPVFRILESRPFDHSDILLESRPAPVREENGGRDAEYAAQKETKSFTCCEKPEATRFCVHEE
jgi:hypothetical protein